MNEEYSFEEPCCHVDCRREQMGKIESPPSVDISTALMATRIADVHNRLLQRATRGLLTWRDDHIVATSRGRNFLHVLPLKSAPPQVKADHLATIGQDAPARQTHHAPALNCTNPLHPTNHLPSLDSNAPLDSKANLNAGLPLDQPDLILI